MSMPERSRTPIRWCSTEARRLLRLPFLVLTISVFFVSMMAVCKAADQETLAPSKLTILLPVGDMESLSSYTDDAVLKIRISNKLYPDAPQLSFVLSYHRQKSTSPSSQDMGERLWEGDRFSSAVVNPPYRFEVSGPRPGYRVLSIRIEGAKPEAISNLDDTIRLEQLKVPFGQYIISSNAETWASDGKPRQGWIQKTEIALAVNEAKTAIIHHPGMVQTLRDTLLSREGGFLAAILALLAALGAAVKKELERLISRLVDALGGYGLRAAAKKRFQRVYINHLISSHRYLRLVGFNVAGLPRPSLEEVYISLRVNSIGTEIANTDVGIGGGISFIDAVRRFDKLVILGAPGAGKTTTLSYIILQFAQRRGTPLFDRPLLPIYIPLRRLSSTTGAILSDLLDPKTQILPDEILQIYPSGFFEQKLLKGECIVLLDGLDEVTNETIHFNVADRINAFVNRYNNTRIIVTCRVAGWRNLLPAFTILEADDLSYDEVHRFVRGWHMAIISLQERNRIEQEYPELETRRLRWQETVPRIRVAIDDYSRRLLNAIDGNPRIMAVATNPMLLSLICLVHLNRNILPRGRALLYAQCVEFLIDAWERSKGFLVSPSQITPAQKEIVLRQIAYKMHESGRGELPRGELERLITTIAVDLGLTSESLDILEDIERRSGLLVERSIDVLGFSHLTLQEYLVAKNIQMNANLLGNLYEYVDNQEWREVILLYAGLIEDASDLIRRIRSGEQFQRILLAGHCVGESQRVDQKLSRELIDELLNFLVPQESMQAELAASALAAIASDFAGEMPGTEQQALSGQLMTWVELQERRAHYAIGVLGKARITRALPVLVDTMVRYEQLREVTTKAVVSFGNLAVEVLTKSAVAGRGTVPLEIFLQPLLEIGTGSAVMTLARLYEPYESIEEQRRISWAIAAVMNNPLVRAELVEIADHDLPNRLITQQLPSRGSSFLAQMPSPSTAFLKLAEKVIQDLVGYIQTGLSTKSAAMPIDTKNAYFGLLLPAVIQAIQRSGGELDVSTFCVLGFDPTPLTEQGTNLANLCRAIRSEDGSIRSIIDRGEPWVRGARTSLQESKRQKVTRILTSGIISGLYIISTYLMIFITIVTIVFVIVNKNSSNLSVSGALVMGIGISTYVGAASWYIISRWHTRRFRTFPTALFLPVQNLFHRVGLLPGISLSSQCRFTKCSRISARLEVA